jgi:radical SAM-linked protein
MRIRITFSKSGSLIYIGNLDLYTMWERASRRADLPLAYSQGFHPQPKIHFAAPLPLGFASRCEVVDMRLNETVNRSDLKERLNAALPADIRVLDVQEVGDEAPAVQTQVLSAEYEILLGDEVQVKGLRDSVGALLAADRLPRRRRDREYDLRPLVEDMELRATPPAESPVLWMKLKAQEGATGRPDEVLLALGIPREHARIERTALHFKEGVPAPPPFTG